MSNGIELHVKDEYEECQMQVMKAPDGEFYLMVKTSKSPRIVITMRKQDIHDSMCQFKLMYEFFDMQWKLVSSIDNERREFVNNFPTPRSVTEPKTENREEKKLVDPIHAKYRENIIKLGERSALLRQKLDPSEFTMRTYNTLKRLDINTIGQLCMTPETRLRHHKGFGVGAMKEAKSFLRKNDLFLGMSIPGYVQSV